MSARREKRRSAGAILIYFTACIVPFIGFASLAVDVSHILFAKTQLQGAVDAAARVGAAQLESGSASSAATAAINYGSENTVDGTSFTLLSSDVVTGNWSNSAFTAGGSPTNAIQVTGHRSGARGTAVKLMWLAVIGSSTFDVSATATAVETSGSPSYGIVAISGANINNALNVDSYNSSLGSYGTSKSHSGSIANGGSWNLSNSAYIDGNLYYSGTMPTNGTVTGARSVLPNSPSLSSQYPLITTLTGTTSMGNYNGGNLNLSAGSYSFTSFSQGSSDILTISGKVQIYVSGNINLNGSVNNNGTPGNLLIYNTQAAGVNISGSNNIFAEIYAPDSPINLNGSAEFYGAMVGSQFSSSGGAYVHIDTALVGGTPTITMAR